MKKFFALFCTAMLLLVSGCGGNGESGAGSATETDPDNLRVAIGGQITTLDPGINTESVNNYIIRHISGNLFHQDENGEIVNELAEDYSVSEDGLTHTIKIREGVKWSDDVPLTSKDFEFTVLRNLTYGAENAWAIYYPMDYLKGAKEAVEMGEAFDPTEDKIEGIETPDDQTLIFHLNKPCPWFRQMLTNSVWRPLRADFADLHDSLWAFEPGYPSVGPYILKEVNENSKAVVVKNEKYWDAENVSMPQITFMVMPDTDAQALAFKNNEIDMALAVSRNIIDTYENKDEIWIMPENTNYFIALNSGETGPDYLKNVDVRRALAISIDKETLVEASGSTLVDHVLNGYITEGFKGVNKDFRVESDEVMKFLEYDPEEAKALLAKAGYDENNPLKIKYKYSQSTRNADVAQILQQMWAAVGIDCELEIVESGVFYDQVDHGNYEMSRYGYTVADDPSQFLTLWTTGQQIVASVDDPVYDEMVDKAGYLVDHDEYMRALHEAEYYLIQDQVYLIPLFNYNTPTLVKTNVKGAKMWGIALYLGDVVIE